MNWWFSLNMRCQVCLTGGNVHWKKNKASLLESNSAVVLFFIELLFIWSWMSFQSFAFGSNFFLDCCWTSFPLRDNKEILSPNTVSCSASSGQVKSRVFVKPDITVSDGSHPCLIPREGQTARGSSETDKPDDIHRNIFTTDTWNMSLLLRLALYTQRLYLT